MEFGRLHRLRHAPVGQKFDVSFGPFNWRLGQVQPFQAQFAGAEGFDFFNDGFVDGRICDDAAPFVDFSFPGFKLRLDEGHDVAPGFDERFDGRQYFCERDEGGVDGGEVGGF